MLVEAEYTDEDGVSHRLTDAEILSFAMLLLAAGSGTTWKQMGITLAAIFERPDVLAAVRADRAARAAGDRGVGAVEADRPDVLAARHPRHRVLGVAPARRARCCTCASVRPTATPRAGTDPTSTTSPVPPKPTLAFGSGPHVCLGMHVARAEMNVGINALLDRLPNLRLDPDAEPPRYIGFYERGATAIPVVFD